MNLLTLTPIGMLASLFSGGDNEPSNLTGWLLMGIGLLMLLMLLMVVI